jgi:hypothetical protein
LISKSNGRVLEYYGEKHPSEERVAKTEKRVQFFKNLGASKQSEVENIENEYEMKIIGDGEIPLYIGTIMDKKYIEIVTYNPNDENSIIWYMLNVITKVLDKEVIPISKLDDEFNIKIVDIIKKELGIKGSNPIFVRTSVGTGRVIEDNGDKYKVKIMDGTQIGNIIDFDKKDVDNLNKEFGIKSEYLEKTHELHKKLADNPYYVLLHKAYIDGNPELHLTEDEMLDEMFKISNQYRKELGLQEDIESKIKGNKKELLQKVKDLENMLEKEWLPQDIGYIEVFHNLKLIKDSIEENRADFKAFIKAESSIENYLISSIESYLKVKPDDIEFIEILSYDANETLAGIKLKDNEYYTEIFSYQKLGLDPIEFADIIQQPVSAKEKIMALSIDRMFRDLTNALEEIDEHIEITKNKVTGFENDVARIILSEYSVIKKELIKMIERKNDLQSKVNRMDDNYITYKDAIERVNNKKENK